jgi:hypothetical protein
MRLPGFTAEGSAPLAHTGLKIGRDLDRSGTIVPAAAGEGSPGWAGCMSDCTDAGGTVAQCRRRCASGGGGGGPVAGGPGTMPANPDCVNICWIGWGICTGVSAVLGGVEGWAGALVGGVLGAGPTCDSIRDGCLSTC